MADAACLLGASAGVACLAPPMASLVLHVLQHTAAAAGLYVQCRVSCQLAAGLVPCVVWLNYPPHFWGRRRSVAALGSLRLLLTGWLLA